jgi:hypothetical protein
MRSRRFLVHLGSYLVYIGQTLSFRSFFACKTLAGRKWLQSLILQAYRAKSVNLELAGATYLSLSIRRYPVPAQRRRSLMRMFRLLGPYTRETGRPSAFPIARTVQYLVLEEKRGTDC